jgi:LytS/YehU family sensor histidine kinase
MEALRFADRFTFRIELDDAIDAGSIDIPPMLIQPYVENAIWHGLLHKKNNEGELEIRLSLENKDLVIEVSDNGVGRAAANNLKSKSASERKSYGMDVTAERLSLLSKLYKRPIHFHIDDLVHPDDSAAGTRVVLTVPVLE